MKMTRRQFLKVSAMAGAMMGAGMGGNLLTPGSAHAFSQTKALQKWMQALPPLGSGIPVASPRAITINGAPADYYRIFIKDYTQLLHPQLPKATKLWGYADATNTNTPVQKHLGPVIVARKNRPVLIRFVNLLPANHPLPVDITIPGAETGQIDNRSAVHLHGGEVPWISDGGPFDWFDPNGNVGPSFLNNSTLNAVATGAGLSAAAPGEAFYYYPNQQSFRLEWYHDHALGTTRLNAYAGIASGYLIDDDVNDALVASGALPSNLVPLIFQDKIFKQRADSWGSPGDLFYPSVYETSRWTPGPNFNPPVPSCVPEFFGDTMLVNGLVYPYLQVQPQQYRFLILNACDARFMNLQLFYADSTGKEPDLTKPGPAMVQVGTEGGFLPAPVVLNNYTPIGFNADPASPTFGNATNYNLLMAPAERADVIIDFSQVPVGSKLILYSDAPAPFPGGDPLNDYFPKSGNPTLTKPGYGPNSRTMLQFQVVSGTQSPVFTLPTLLGPDPALPFDLATITPGQTPPGFAGTVRNLTLNEDFDERGRLIQRMGTDVQLHAGTYARGYMEPMDAPTEILPDGSTEVWLLYNLTGDTHPIHFHLFNVQVLWRAQFSGPGSFSPIPGTATLPDANEQGWKETVRMNPGEVIAVAFTANLPSVPFTVPFSPRLQSAFGINNGHEFVYHCHILEHEEHDMMRPLVITTPQPV